MLTHCQRYPSLKFFNQTTGEYYPFSCKCYKCEFCGVRKIARLRRAMSQWLSQFKHIRLWTFTVSSAVIDDRNFHTKVLQLAWKTFITYVRRCNALPKSVRFFQYVKIFEPHASGYLHIHAFITDYLDWHVINAIWQTSVLSAAKFLLKEDKNSEQMFKFLEVSKIAHCNVKGIFGAARAASYVCKYILKFLEQSSGEVKKIWSKSGNCTIFSDTSKIFVNGVGKFELIRVHMSGFPLNLKDIRITAQIDQEELKLIDLLEFFQSVSVTEFGKNDDTMIDEFFPKTDFSKFEASDRF
jgi:hypothetical protein